MNELMTALLGTNWRTSAASYAQLAVITVATYFYEGGQWPISPEGWAMIGYGIFGAIKGHATQDARPVGQLTRASDVPPVITSIPPK